MSEHKIEQIYLHTREQAINNIESHTEKFYVYILVNPLNNMPFYVGKGSGYRCLVHWANKNKLDSINSRFLMKLDQKGYEPLYCFFGFYDNEKLAYNAEAKLIHKYGRKTKDKGNLLYNIDGGQGFKSFSLKTERVVARFREAHKDKYDYSLVVFKGSHFKVEIVCEEHGSFFQLPRSHWSGRGCPECSGNRPKTTLKFIEEALTVHGDLYDYSKTVYTSAFEKITITCLTHGDFEISASAHTNHSQGCPKCRYMRSSNSQKATLESFASKANMIHGGKYSYFEYEGNSTPVKMFCPIKHHGNFYQAPGNHLQGQGCPKCRGKNKYKEGKLCLHV